MDRLKIFISSTMTDLQAERQAVEQAIALTPEGLGVVAGDSAGNVYCLRYVAPEAS